MFYIRFIFPIKETPFHKAACEGASIEVLEILLQNRADIHMKNAAGETPLLMAAKYGYVDVVKTLLKNGADIHEKLVAIQFK